MNFVKKFIDTNNDVFQKLNEFVKFEVVTKGRLGCILVNNANKVPIVRTTTKYNDPAQLFTDIHYEIIDAIKKAFVDVNLEFNNAMLETYNSEYFSMGFHSDQALDLDPNSYICLFSCYNIIPDQKNTRILRIKNKESNEQIDIMLEHNSVVIFSTETNKKYLHKIILPTNEGDNGVVWTGLTLRMSKTFVQFHNNVPYIINDNTNVPLAPLALATDNETKEFYKQRSNENKLTNFEYSQINFTISKSDLLPII